MTNPFPALKAAMSGLEWCFCRYGRTVFQSFNCINPCPDLGLLFCLFSLACAGMLGLCDRRAKKILKQREERTSKKISIKDLKDFPLRLWLLFFISLTYYVTVFPFIALAP